MISISGLVLKITTYTFCFDNGGDENAIEKAIVLKMNMIHDEEARVHENRSCNQPMDMLITKMSLVASECPIENKLAEDDRHALKYHRCLAGILQIVHNEHSWIDILRKHAPELFKPCKERRVVECPNGCVLHRYRDAFVTCEYTILLV